MISALFLLFGIYLIFIGEVITGAIAIVIALFIFPRGKRKYSDTDQEDNNDTSYAGDSRDDDSDGDD